MKYNNSPKFPKWKKIMFFRGEEEINQAQKDQVQDITSEPWVWYEH